LSGCIGKLKQETAEEPVRQETPTADERGFDPLELPGDTKIVSKDNPQSGIITGQQGLISTDDGIIDADSGYVSLPDVPEEKDTLNSQAFRVQLLTSKAFGEARQAASVAEEIFDRPVYVDYEVPYFKLRVGSFGNRDDAELYKQKARAVGYSNAWVVAVTVNVQETTPLYESLPGVSMPEDSVMSDNGLIDDEES
jgi:hypothetical protein